MPDYWVHNLSEFLKCWLQCSIRWQVCKFRMTKFIFIYINKLNIFKAGFSVRSSPIDQNVTIRVLNAKCCNAILPLVRRNVFLSPPFWAFPP